jgi:hypothetical protein
MVQGRCAALKMLQSPRDWAKCQKEKKIRVKLEKKKKNILCRDYVEPAKPRDLPDSVNQDMRLMT